MKLGSEDEARQLILSILPEPDIRQKCLTVFAEAIEEANRHGRHMWAVTHTKDKLRLVVGHIRVQTVEDRPDHGPNWMALDEGLLGISNHKSLLERSEDWEWDVIEKPDYPRIKSSNGYYSPSEKHAEVWPIVKPLHFESICKAANRTTMDPRTPKGHSPEILSFIRKELGRQLPDPLYEPYGGREQPAKSVIGVARSPSDDFVPGRIFGHIPGYPEGSCFESRAELSVGCTARP